MTRFQLHQILGGYCKQEASIIKSIVDSVVKEIFPCFHMVWQFTGFSEGVFISPLAM